MFNAIRIFELENLIKKHRMLYSSGRAKISDSEYDALEMELKELDPGNQLLQDVGADIQSSTFAKVNHNVPMLSLGKAYTIEEVLNWVPELDGYNGIAMPKMDGFAISLKYRLAGKHFVLYQAVTRGKGQHGEDVTENIKMIEDIPNSILANKAQQLIPDLEKFEIRGEVYMKHSVFQELRLFETHENCRNICPGSVRQKDPTVTRDRKLSFFAYNIIGLGKYIDNMNYRLVRIGDLFGFSVVPFISVDLSLKNSIQEAFDFFNTEKEKYDFDIDGVVVSLSNCKKIESLGNTSHHPRGMIAWKFETENAETTLLNVLWQVSRTGLINPVGVYNGVRLDGATLTQATLHNLSEIKRLGIGIGDRIIVNRRGGTIPKIIEVVKSEGNGIDIPEICPVCGIATELHVSDKGAETLHCSNINCPAVTMTKILHFIKVMEIDDVAESMVTKLLDAGFINDPSDLFSVTREQLLTLDKVKNRKASITLKNIALAKKRPLAKFLQSLGIHTLGNSVSRDIADTFMTLKAVLNATEVDLFGIEGIGPETAKNVVEGIKANEDLIVALLFHIEVMEVKPTEDSGLPLAGKSFLMTGTLSMKRNDFKKIVTENGGVVKSSVSKTLNYLVVGDSPGGKVAKAKKAGVTIITEEEFNALLS